MLCFSFGLFERSLSSEKERLLDNKNQIVCYALVKQEELLPYCGHSYIPYSDILMGLQSKEVEWSSTPPNYDAIEDVSSIAYKFQCSIKEAKSSVKNNSLTSLSELTVHTGTSGWLVGHEIIPVTVVEKNKEKPYVIKSELINSSLEKSIR